MDIKVEHYHDPRPPVTVNGVKQIRITTSSGDFIIYDRDVALEVRSGKSLHDGLVVVPVSTGAVSIELREIK